MAIAPPFLRVLGCFRPSRLHRFLSTEERLGFRPDIPPPAMEPRRHHPKNGLLFSGLFGLDVILFPLLGSFLMLQIRVPMMASMIGKRKNCWKGIQADEKGDVYLEDFLTSGSAENETEYIRKKRTQTVSSILDNDSIEFGACELRHLALGTLMAGAGLLRCCRIRLNGTFMRHWDRIAVFEVARFLPRSVSAARCRPKGQVLAFVCSSCLCQSEITAFTAPFDALPCSVTALAAFAA
ncbi:s-formylglutathione [Musa troglodytarum]|uniref:S-formylglutathione n=1 Tax=Musa troglodytarum TaxID=320322 RepID=A0A9E7G0F4_9LILI|nr:s-formylglutathione [Musa troglodytarum]